MALWEAAGNEYFGLLLQPVQETLATYMHDVLEAADEERLRSIAQRHEQIVDAPAAARQQRGQRRHAPAFQ